MWEASEKWGTNSAVIAGPVSDARGITTYGGRTRRGPGRLSFDLLTAGVERRADTMNGNVVLVPVAVHRRLGGFDPAFTHSLADFDFGLRATLAGVPLVALGRHVRGQCEINTGEGGWRDAHVTLSQRLRSVFGPKGLPPAGGTLCRSALVAALFWPQYLVSPYLRAFAGGVGARRSQ